MVHNRKRQDFRSDLAKFFEIDKHLHTAMSLYCLDKLQWKH